MATQEEIEAAAKAVSAVRNGGTNWQIYVNVVMIALEAAERVRDKYERLKREPMPPDDPSRLTLGQVLGQPGALGYDYALIREDRPE